MRWWFRVRKKPHIVKEGHLWIIYRTRQDSIDKKPIWLFSLDFDGACREAKNFWDLKLDNRIL